MNRVLLRGMATGMPSGFWLSVGMLVALCVALWAVLIGGQPTPGSIWTLPALALAMVLAVHHGDRVRSGKAALMALNLAGLGLLLLAAGWWMVAAAPTGAGSSAFWAAMIGVWLGAWAFVSMLTDLPRRRGLAGQALALLAPVVFGVTVLWLWEVVVTALQVPRVILPAPSAIAARIATSTGTLWIDFVQTFVKGALSGFAIGCGAAIAFAILVDRFDFLRRGLLPVGNFVAALPIIGTAPIMVMWFGFDWPSKSAVVVAMVFFPMLVNAVQGLAAADRMQRDLMHTYSASPLQELVKLRLPAAMPFIFNGLKICSTLALIGAIVAEFFGSPTRGMGFRISTEVGRLQLDMVWAEITVAAVAGSLFYGVWAALERWVTFWHPSQRGR